VYDGDSLRIRFLDGHGIPISQPQRRVNPSRITAEDALKVKNEQLSIRLCSIDAPEVSQDYGTLARDLLRGEVQGTEVWVQIMDRDQYGRLVANVYLRDGTQLNRLMVSQGLAWHYEQFSRDSELARLQQEAQRAGRGLWASPRPLPPWEYRKTRRYQN
jgi:endonuclease YncB( thermonuclease family)